MRRSDPGSCSTATLWGVCPTGNGTVCRLGSCPGRISPGGWCGCRKWGVFIRAGALAPPEDLIGLGEWSEHRTRLRTCYDTLRRYYPAIVETGDNFSRLTDWTFEVAGLSETQLEDMSRISGEEGWGFTYSSVHCHIMDKRQEKGVAIEKVINSLDDPVSLDEVVTIGDSLNDTAMFNPERFPLSVGVKNIETYLPRMDCRPKYISHYDECDGFLSLVKIIVCLKNSSK